MRKTNTFGETTDRLNRLLIARELADTVASQRADLSAKIVKTGQSDYRLKVFNRGQNVGLNVRLVDLDLDDSLLIADDLQRKFPIAVFGQHQSVELSIDWSIQFPPRAHIKLIWDDGAGKDTEKELTLVA